jgi:hypothetical protein
MTFLRIGGARWSSGQCTQRLNAKAKQVEVSYWMDDQNLLSRAPPCFGKHVKLLVPATFAVVSIHSSFKEG